MPEPLSSRPLAAFATLPATPPGFFGVAVADPGVISASIQRQVAAALTAIPAGKRGALLAAVTERGVNLVVAHKVNDNWHVAAWLGKSGWDRPIEGGVATQLTW